MSYKHDCDIENAAKFADWCQSRGGVAVWASVNLSNTSASWSTPALDGCPVCGSDKGRTDCKCKGTAFVPHQKPSWQAASQPSHIVSDPAEIGVYRAKEVKRFYVGVRVSDNGMMLKVTDAGSERIRREVEKAGEGAFHSFCYETQEAVIYSTQSIGSLKDWMDKYEAVKTT